MLERLYHYDFLDGRLIGSENPDLPGRARQIAERLARERGVRLVISLTPMRPSLAVDGLRHVHLPMPGVPHRDDVVRAVALIAEGLESGAVWVHCQQGIDRTGCVLGSYLASTGWGCDRVVEELFSRFPAARRQPVMRELWKPYVELIRSFAPAA